MVITLSKVQIVCFAVLIVSLFYSNFIYRRQVVQLKKRLKELGGYEQYVTYLQNQQQGKDKIAAIKALRQQFPELSLLEATQLWQQVYEEQILNLQ